MRRPSLLLLLPVVGLIRCHCFRSLRVRRFVNGGLNINALKVTIDLVIGCGWWGHLFGGSWFQCFISLLYSLIHDKFFDFGLLTLLYSKLDIWLLLSHHVGCISYAAFKKVNLFNDFLLFFFLCLDFTIRIDPWTTIMWRFGLSTFRWKRFSCRGLRTFNLVAFVHKWRDVRLKLLELISRQQWPWLCFSFFADRDMSQSYQNCERSEAMRALLHLRLLSFLWGWSFLWRWLPIWHFTFL